MSRSIFQSLLFMQHGGIVMALPGPEVVSIAMGVLFNFVGGVLIGQILLGYSGSYSEYYHERSS